MNLEIVRLANALGAEVRGVDLRDPPAADTINAIERAWLEHHVLLFREQKLTPAQLIAFTERLGEIERKNALSHYSHPEFPEIFMVTNHPIGGKPSETRNTGRQWHSDLCYTLRPPRGSLLHAQEVPPVGGDTMFANMQRAYETLSAPIRAMLEPLWAVTDFANSRDIARRDPNVVAEMKRRTPPVAQPVIRTNPETGRKALYVNEAATVRIIDLHPAESRAILDFLFNHSVVHENVYRHRWQVHDLLMWDNYSTIHIALADYEHSSPRHMFRTTLIGSPSGRALTRDGQELIAA
jgi:taurine dioxygenase